jgi:hypothetical protein
MSSVRKRDKALTVNRLKIYIDISVPESIPFLLTSDMLHYTGSAKLEKYPFFIDTVKYPQSVLLRLNYNQLVEFFFIKKTFLSKIQNANPKPNTRKNRKVRKENKVVGGGNHRIKIHGGGDPVIGESNFKMMITLLFPTAYPIANHFYDSYGVVTNQTIMSMSENPTDPPPTEVPDLPLVVPEPPNKKGKSNEIVSNFYGTLTNFLTISNRKISYIKYEKQDYTITEIIWLNDFLNYPIYTELIEKYDLYIETKDKLKQSMSVNNDQEIINIFKNLTNINPITLPEIYTYDEIVIRSTMTVDDKRMAENQNRENKKKKEDSEKERNKKKLYYNNNALIIIPNVSQKSQDYGNSILVNEKYIEIEKLIRTNNVLDLSNIQKIIESGETLINAYKKLTEPNVSYTIRGILLNLKTSYDKRQLEIILDKFEESFDINNVNSSEKEIINKRASSVLKLGEIIQKIKKRIMSNVILKNILEKPNPNPINTHPLHNFIDFIESYKYGEGGDTEYSKKDMKILFDIVMDKEQTSADKEPKEESSFMEAYLLMNVIEGKYTLNTIADIDCKYKDYELAVLNGKLYDDTDSIWDMRSRKTYFSEKKHTEEIQRSFNKIMTPVPTTEPLVIEDVEKNKGEKKQK